MNTSHWKRVLAWLPLDFHVPLFILPPSLCLSFLPFLVPFICFHLLFSWADKSHWPHRVLSRIWWCLTKLQIAGVRVTVFRIRPVQSGVFCWSKKKEKQMNNNPSPPPHTFRLSSAASSFFWISSRDGSRRCGMEVLRSGTPSKEGGLRMTSKAWPDARLFSSITSTSLMTHQPRSTASVVLDSSHGQILYFQGPFRTMKHIVTYRQDVIFEASCGFHCGLHYILSTCPG